MQGSVTFSVRGPDKASRSSLWAGCQRELKSDSVQTFYRKAGKPVTRSFLKNIQISDCRKVLSIDMQISGMFGAVFYGEVIQCLNQLMR